MRYSIENEAIRLTVSSVGAEAVSVISKATGSEMLWCGDPAVWARQAPMLFPFCGRLTQGKFVAADGSVHESGPHGFARDMDFALAEQTDTSLTLTLAADEETRALWPYDFALTVRYELKGRTVHHRVTVRNTGECELRFGLGFHPGYAVPFDDAHSYTDYDIAFDAVESPLCLSTAPHGLIGAAPDYYLARNVTRVPLTPDLFANDSHCMTGLKSKTLSIVERDSGRRVSVDIADFPYVLLWSMPQLPLRFVCIEPWHCLPGEENGPLLWEDKPCAASLAPGESWETTLRTSFER